MRFAKPSRLMEGDTVAVVSPSSGLPSMFPRVYELGIRMLEQRLGLRVKEYPTARADSDFLYRNPRTRAEDVNKAFGDPDVKAIIASIGGDDSIRTLPYLDKEAIESNPKILMGYSDTTTLLSYCNQVGLVTFHGPSVMAGLSQMESLPPSFTSHIKEMLFHANPTYQYRPYEAYSEGYPHWSKMENLGKVNESKKNPSWNWLQGESRVEGELFGGNIEILEWTRGTEFWPGPDFWQGKILFLETSEEKPPPVYVKRWLRNFGIQGLLDRIGGILIGRARDYSDEEKKKLDSGILSVVKDEFDKPDLSVVTNLDFGHTDPQFIIPLGAKAEIDPDRRSFRLLESPVE